jgi:hypothetical protein
VHARLGRLAAIAATGTAIAACLVAPSAFGAGAAKPALTRYDLTPPPGLANGDQFGFGLAVSGSLAVVGANDAKADGHAGQGEVMLYRRGAHGWTNTKPLATLTDGTSTANDSFGPTIATDGHTIVIGADGSGKVYVFEEPKSGWKSSSHPTAVLSASSAKTGDFYGFPVALSGSTIAVGDYLHAAGGTYEAGAIYLYTRHGAHWKSTATPTAEIDPPTPTTYEDFGSSIALSGNTLVTGAVGAGGTGEVFVYTKPTSGWSHASAPRELLGADSVTSDDFGWSVGLTGSTLFVGAQERKVNSVESGSVYVFPKPSGGWGSAVDPTLTSATILTEAAPGEGDAFGRTLTASGNQLTVSAPFRAMDGKASVGDVWLFTRPAAGWKSTTTASGLELKPDHILANESYGESLATDGHSLLIDVLNGGKNRAGAAEVLVPKPTISSVKQTKKSWKSETKFSFTLTNPATVALSFSEKKHGHYKHVGTIKVQAKAGTTSVQFKGKISHGKKLTAGKCEVQIRGASTYGDTSAKTLKFTVTG